MSNFPDEYLENETSPQQTDFRFVLSAPKATCVPEIMKIGDDLHHFQTDFGVLMSVCGIEILRIIVARRGNLTENKWLIIVAILLTIPSVVGVVYLMILQSEVLRFEYIICSIQLGLCLIEIISGVLCLFPCCKVPEYY